MKSYDKMIEGGIKLVLLVVGLMLLSGAGIQIYDNDWRWRLILFDRLLLCTKVALGILFIYATFSKNCR